MPVVASSLTLIRPESQDIVAFHCAAPAAILNDASVVPVPVTVETGSQRA